MQRAGPVPPPSPPSTDGEKQGKVRGQSSPKDSGGTFTLLAPVQKFLFKSPTDLSFALSPYVLGVQYRLVSDLH